MKKTRQKIQEEKRKKERKKKQIEQTNKFRQFNGGPVYFLNVIESK